MLKSFKLKNKFILLLILLFIFPLTGPGKEKVHATVARIIDGDTIVVYFQGKHEKLRLTGIDTPEKNNNYKTRRDSRKSGLAIREIIRQGKAADRFVKSLVSKGDTVWLEFDVQQRDRYGRLLAYVYLHDGSMLNEVIIKSGYASVMTYPPNVRYKERFMQGYWYARKNRLGLFGDE